MKLINGRGQLGEMFQKNIKLFYHVDATLYHTWNYIDKSKTVQLWCFNRFRDYIYTHEESIIFISTKSEEYNFYTEYKRKSEELLKEKCAHYSVIRLPNIIGKGICTRFIQNPSLEAYGNLELITLEEAYENIRTNLFTNNSIININGEKISAKLAKILLLFKR
jgi:hypothetical protein